MANSKKEATNHYKISVVIPTFNRQTLALEAAVKLRNMQPTAQITVVEQEAQSRPDSELLNKYAIDYLSLDRANTSIAKNKGIQNSVGDIIFFFDDDVEITPETIEAHLEAYDDNEVVATSGRVINDHENIPHNTDVITGKTNLLATVFIKQFWSTRKQFVDFPYGCNMSFRHEIVKKIGGFDETFPKIFEEIDLGKRVRKYGKIAFVPDALAYHHKAKSGGTRDTIRKKASMLYRYYGQYIAKQVVFPLSLLSLIIRTKTVLHEAPFALKDFYLGYIAHFYHALTGKSKSP